MHGKHTSPRLPAVARACETCGAAFFAKAAKVRVGEGKFCSRVCTNAARGAPAIEKTCAVCDTPFTTWPSQNKRFCSRSCRYEAQTIREPRPCENCGKPFLPANRLRRFCSRDCVRWRTTEQRFWELVEKTPTCWLVTQNNGERGYGTFWGADGQRMLSHRFAWELVAGPIPDGLFVLHDCPDGDNKFCVRNDTVGFHNVNGIARPQRGHLWIGTQAENMADMQLKGRSPHAKLTPDQVREIKVWLSKGLGVTEIARAYTMTRSAIMGIQRGDSWKYV